MKPGAKSLGKAVDDSLALFKDLSTQEIEKLRVGALQYLDSAPTGEVPADDMDTLIAPLRSRSHSRWLAFASIGAAVTIAVFVPTRALRSAPAVFEEASGSRNIQYGEVVRGGTLKFPSGSRVEISPESEVLLERADEGVRLTLHKADVVVVRSGEAQVQQGETNRTLRAGEQVQMEPTKHAPQVSFEIASIAVLANPTPSSPQAPTEVREKLEAASASGSATTQMPDTARSRGITYLAGCDTCRPLTTADDQRKIYLNVVAPMTVASVTCFAEAGNITIDILRDNGTGSAVSILNAPLTCNSIATQNFAIATLALNDRLDFDLVTTDGIGKRVTVAIKTFVN